MLLTQLYNCLDPQLEIECQHAKKKLLHLYNPGGNSASESGSAYLFASIAIWLPLVIM